MFDNLISRAKATRLAAVLVSLALCLGVGGFTAATATAALGDHVAPQNVTAVASPDGYGTYDVTVGWDPVDPDDTSTVCAILDGQGEQCFGASTTQTTFSGVTPGTYTATVSSIYYGCGCSNATTAQVTITEELPGTPEDIDTYVADGTVTVYFNPSQTEGAGDADTFEVTVGDLTASVNGPYAYSVDFVDVAPGTYPVSVTATNTAGSSATAFAAADVYVTAATKPSAPRNLTVSEFKNASVSWAWDAPTDNGGADILGYEAAITFPDGDGTFEEDFGGTYALDVDLLDGELDWAAYDLPTDQGDFVITMYARNEAGIGPAVVSAPMPVPTSTIPSAPTNVVATSPWENTVTVTFGAPASDGGLAVEGYLVTVNGEERWLDATDERSWTFYGVPAGSYTASVEAYNNNQDEMGFSPAGTSAAVSVANYVPPVVVTPPPVVVTPPVVSPPVVVKPAARAPSAPRAVAATSVKAGKVVVTFKAPASINGAAVSGYVLTLAGQEKRVNAGVRTVTFTGITKGTYAVKVAAKNSAGGSTAGTTSVFMSKAKAAANPLTLKFGMRGTTIEKLQAKLDMPGRAQTALFDAATRTAVLKWQKKHGKKQTAVVNAAMRSTLGV